MKPRQERSPVDRTRRVGAGRIDEFDRTAPIEASHDRNFPSA